MKKIIVLVLVFFLMCFLVNARTFTRDSITVGDKVSFEVEKTESSNVREFGFSALRSLSQVNVEAKDVEADGFNLGREMSSFELSWTGVDKFDVNDAYVVFVVDGAKLKEMDINKDDIELAQRQNGEWVKDEAEYVNRYGKEFWYKANVNDISGVFIGYVEENKNSPLVEEKKEVKETKENQDNAVTGEAVSEGVESNGDTFNGFGIVISMIIGLIVFVSAYVYFHRQDFGKHDFS